MTTKNNKKNNSARKIIPAAGMLMVSALMLSTSTYAWFTMSREVEVKNIQMTATVPEDIQISLGHLTITDSSAAVNASNAKDHKGLGGSEGILTPASSTAGSTADDGGVKEPNTGTDAVSMLDWSNTADISEYYRLGRIIPASSIDGEDIFFTPDASGNGTTLKSGAEFYQAASIDTAYAWDDTNKTYAAAVAASTEFARTKLHAIDEETKANDEWGTATDLAKATPEYTVGTAWNVTNDDGYYVDIPVWLRTSNTVDTKLAVDAYVTTNSTVDGDDLYLAARAAIIYSTDTTVADANKTSIPNPDSTGLIKIRQDTWTGSSIVDFMYSTNATGDAVESVANKVPTYGDAEEYNATTKFLTLDKATGAGNNYGKPTKAIIRVWLEGEDPNCWNQNAGQNFNICLKFTKEALETDITSAITAAADRTGANAATSLKTGDFVYVKTITGTTTNTLKFTYDADVQKWNLTDGSMFYSPAYNYTYNSQPITNSDDIATQLKTTVDTHAKVLAADTVSEAIQIEGVAKT